MNYPASSQIEGDARRGAARERRCVASGEVLPEAQLIRFARGPDGVLVPDVAAKLPGRGAWVRASRESVEQATKKNGFAHALKAQVKPADSLAALTETLLARRCLDFLGLARRAGAIAFGATQVEQAIRAKPAQLLIEAAVSTATDASTAGTAKIVAACVSGAVLAGWGGAGEEPGTEHPARTKNAIAITNAGSL